MMFSKRFLPYMTALPSIEEIGGRPDTSAYVGVQKDDDCCLLVGGATAPNLPGQWETLDPFDPGKVTHRARLENKALADKLADRFSLIQVHAVFEHINPLHYAACVRNLHTMLKVGGILSVEAPWLWAYHPRDKRYDFGGDFARFTTEGLRRLFEEHPACRWKTLLCEYAIPKDAPDGVGVCAIFRKDVK